jgi:hypothetical protein
VTLTELCEGLVSSPLQSIVKVVVSSRGKLSRHSRVSGVSRNVHMDHTAPQPELTLRATIVRGNPRVAKSVQHVRSKVGKLGRCNPS